MISKSFAGRHLFFSEALWYRCGMDTMESAG